MTMRQPLPDHLTPEQQLAGLTQTLHARLAKAPWNSPTAQQVRAQSARLANERVSVADRLTLVRRLLDDIADHYGRDRVLADAKVPPPRGRS